jgi:LysR family transcriptional regulator, nitrogen assimilation regulatory protein
MQVPLEVATDDSHAAARWLLLASAAGGSDPTVDLRQLKYFVAIAEQENFSRAAQQLYVAQSALSRRMRDLEEELGVRLFDRHLRGAALTPEGRDLLERARYLLRSFEQLRTDLVEPRALPSGPVGVGMTPNFAAMVGAQFAHELRSRYPQARLRIVEAYSPELRDMIRSGAIDMAVLSGNAMPPVPALAVEPLFEDRLCLVGLATDPLLRRNEIGVQQLRGLPLILTGMSSAGIRNEVEALASRKRIALQVSVEVASIGLATQMIRLGMGYTVYVGAGVAQEQDLAAVPISGLWLTRSLAWPLDRPMSRLGGEVLALLRGHLGELVASGGWRGARVLRAGKAAA